MWENIDFKRILKYIQIEMFPNQVLRKLVKRHNLVNVLRKDDYTYKEHLLGCSFFYSYDLIRLNKASTSDDGVADFR